MDLKNAINNTNAQKENIKTVANNIDNKLIELGGEKAENLNDVPNKIQDLRNNFIKYAEGDFNGLIQKFDGVEIDTKTILLNLNLNFTPKVLILDLEACAGSGTPWKKNTFDIVKGSCEIVTGNWKEPYVFGFGYGSGLTPEGNLKICFNKRDSQAIWLKFMKWRAYEKATV